MALYVLTGVLGAVFLASSLPQLADPLAAALAMTNFGVTKGVRPWFGRGLGAGHRFSCACFGNDDQPLSGWTLARNIALLLVRLAGTVMAALTAHDAAPGVSARVVDYSFGLVISAAGLICYTLLSTRPFASRIWPGSEA